jgi:hypothetical protein
MAVYRSDQPGSAARPSHMVEDGEFSPLEDCNDFPIIDAAFCMILSQVAGTRDGTMVDSIRAAKQFPHLPRHSGQKVRLVVKCLRKDCVERFEEFR